MYIEVSYVRTFNEVPILLWEGAPKNGLICSDIIALIGQV